MQDNGIASKILRNGKVFEKKTSLNLFENGRDLYRYEESEWDTGNR